MKTVYMVTLKHLATGKTYDKSFDTMTERVLWIMTSAPIASVVKEWIASGPEDETVVL